MYKPPNSASTPDAAIPSNARSGAAPKNTTNSACCASTAAPSNHVNRSVARGAARDMPLSVHRSPSVAAAVSTSSGDGLQREHRRRVGACKNDAVTAELLGVVQRAVGGADQRVGGFAVHLADRGDTDADRHAHALTFPVDHFVLDRAA